MNIEERNDKTRDNETTDAVVVIESADQIDLRDDQEIVQMMTGQAIDAYVYSFRQGGKIVEGLTLAGVNEAANRRGGIQVEEAQYEDRENSWIAVVKATDTLTGNSRYGACEQPKKTGRAQRSVCVHQGGSQGATQRGQAAASDAGHFGGDRLLPPVEGSAGASAAGGAEEAPERQDHESSEGGVCSGAETAEPF